MINFSAGVMTVIVVAIFAVVKFTEGAWVVVVLFVVLVPALIRMNREYTAETEVLETISENQPPPAPHYSRRTVFVFVDGFDLATLAALRYARSLRPTTIRAVHFVVDSVRADKLRDKWTRADRGVPLDFIDVPDRRLTRAAAELVEREGADPGTHVTVVLPRRSYSALRPGLDDRTADKIAAVVSRIPRSAATIIPYDVESRRPGAPGTPCRPRWPPSRTPPTSTSGPRRREVAAKHGPAADRKPRRRRTQKRPLRNPATKASGRLRDGRPARPTAELGGRRRRAASAASCPSAR